MRSKKYFETVADQWMGFKREDIERWFVEAGLKEVSLDKS